MTVMLKFGDYMKYILTCGITKFLNYQSCGRLKTATLQVLTRNNWHARQYKYRLAFKCNHGDVFMDVGYGR